MSKNQPQYHHANMKDRVSDLPDALIYHIFLFLPTIDAVRTCVLSTRWKYMWTLVTKFDFQDAIPSSKRNEHFILRGMVSTCVHLWGDMDLLMKNIFKHNGLFFHRFPRIRAVIERNVHELGLEIKIPQTLFRCEDLTVLKFRPENKSGITTLDVPTFVSFPRLKVLHLGFLQYLDDYRIENILAGSPVLEELVISGCSGRQVQCLHIHSSSLKILKILNSGYNWYVVSQSANYGVNIDAPNLQAIELNDFFLRTYNMELASLVMATVDAGHVRYDEVFPLMRQISTVEFLSLSGNIAMNASFINTVRDGNFPLFRNLKHLKVDIEEDGHLMLVEMLKCSPNLEAFVLNLRENAHEVLLWYCSIASVPQFVMSRLEMIELMGLQGCAIEMAMVSYFLEKAVVLKKMKISCPIYFPKRVVDAIKLEVSNFPTSSSTCEIAFS